jgi:hypothetical protein
MAPSQKQLDYLDRRRKLLNLWRFAGPFLLFVIFALVLYLKIYTPLLIDPYEVLSRLEAGAIEQSSLELIAILLPVMVIMICVLLIAFVFFIYAAFSNERKYLAIINAQKGPGD